LSASRMGLRAGRSCLSPFLSSRAERPDFLLRVAFWRVGSRSRGICLSLASWSLVADNSLAFVVAGLQTGSFSCLLIAGRWSLIPLSQMPQEQRPLSITNGAQHIIYRLSTIIYRVLDSNTVCVLGLAALVTGLQGAGMPGLILGVDGAEPPAANATVEGSGSFAGLIHEGDGLARPLEVAGFCLVRLLQRGPSSCGQYTPVSRGAMPAGALACGFEGFPPRGRGTQRSVRIYRPGRPP